MRARVQTLQTRYTNSFAFSRTHYRSRCASFVSLLLFAIWSPHFDLLIFITWCLLICIRHFFESWNLKTCCADSDEGIADRLTHTQTEWWINSSISTWSSHLKYMYTHMWTHAHAISKLLTTHCLAFDESIIVSFFLMLFYDSLMLLMLLFLHRTSILISSFYTPNSNHCYNSGSLVTRFINTFILWLLPTTATTTSGGS